MITIRGCPWGNPFFGVRPAWALSLGCKSRMVVVAIAQGKGVYREMESEGGRRQIFDLRNKNLI